MRMPAMTLLALNVVRYLKLGFGGEHTASNQRLM
jgi:hypothetical protein